MARKAAEEALALALALGSTVEAAARHAGISKRTAFRRLQDSAFQRRVQALRGELFARAVAKLTGHSTAAAETLGKLLQAAEEGVRLRAAKTILELANTLRQAVELEERL